LTDTSLTASGGRAIGAAPAPGRHRQRGHRGRGVRWNLDYLGLTPFVAFLVLFLIVPAISVFIEALKDGNGGYGLAALGDAFSGQNREAFVFTATFSAIASVVGMVLGTLLAYAVATAQRPRWLRGFVTAFCAVAANMGGIVLAFGFISLLGKQGLGTKILDFFGAPIYDWGFDFRSTWGLTVVYSYFNIPLMYLVTLPAVDGLKQSWREASSNLGGTTFTYWRRVGLPVLTPSLLGGFFLLFANSFSAYATAAALTDTSKIIALRIGFYLGGDVNTGEDAVGFAIATWMIVVMAVCMGLYWVFRKRAERWKA
jgi:putative spermidine/putrescine transport system permease protein